MTAAKKFVILALVSCVSTAAPCVGSSAGLRAATCAAWQEFYDSTFAHATGCVGTRDAPCSCTEGVSCNATDITAITLGQINPIGWIVGLEVLELEYVLSRPATHHLDRGLAVPDPGSDPDSQNLLPVFHRRISGGRPFKYVE